VHAFWADEPGLIAVLSASVLRVPAVVSFQGGELVGFEDLQYGLQLLRGRPTLIRFVARRAAMLTACSGYLRKLAQQWLPQRLAGKVGYATLGVDLERFHTMPATTAVRDDWTRVLSVGSLYPVKQHALAIDVIARVPRTRLTIVGRGPLEDALRAHAQRLGVDERVSLAGARDHVDMPSVYRSADVFLHTSRHEAHCTAVLEAAASHVPVVGTPVGVIPDVGVAAVGVDALADAVERLARRPEARQELAARAFERTRHEYSLVAAAAQHEGIYARVRART
ncbi:MAG: glycosyltransferase, partial [Vicinamibacterales bacterium]